MRWIRYAVGGTPRIGVVEDDRIVEMRGDFFGTSESTGERHHVSDVRILPPVVPATFYAAGLNYMTHLRNHPELQPPTQCDIGYRAVNALIGPGEAIVIPADSSGKVEFEAELVVVIGRKARNVSKEDALSCVFGYTIGNDVSERNWQRSDRTLWRAKNSDTFKPMGPWIQTDVVESMVTRVRLNGKEVSHFPTNDMIFGVAEHIASMTRFVTLYPGDVIWMGTDEPTLEMVAGDEVEIDLDGIGTLRNPVVSQPCTETDGYDAAEPVRPPRSRQR